MSAGQSFFLGAPATKLLSIVSVLSYVLIHSKNAHNLMSMSMDTSRVLQQGEWYRLLTTHIAFGSTGEVVLGTLILAHFSKRFEREMGSRKFILWLLQVYLVVIPLFLWTICIISLLSTLSAGGGGGGGDQKEYASSGPYPTLGALLYLYYKFTPRLHPRFFGVLGFNISEKAIPYAIALPMVFYQGAATLIPTMCGTLAAWLAIHYPMDNIIPNGVADMCSSFASPLVEAPPGMLAPRQQQQQQQPRAAPRVAAAALQPQQQQQQQQPPSQEAIDQLTSMGFDRETVVRALQQSNNSVERALDRLLSGS